MLVNDQQTLTKEREKAEWKRRNNLRSTGENENIGSTSVGLKIPNNSDLAFKEESTCHQMNLAPLHQNPHRFTE